MSMFKIKFKDYEFAPSFTGTLITLLLFSLFVYLGIWQLSRMETKKTISSDLKHRLEEEVIDFSSDTEEMIERDLESFRFQRMQITGHFLQNQDILLDNQIYEGRAGYHVLTPFLPNHSNMLILVDRGYIPWGEDRNELPDIAPIVGEKSLVGIINKYSVGLTLAKEEISNDLWPLRVQTIQFAMLSKIFEKPIAPFIVQLEKGNPYSFKVKPINFGVTADKHLGYAIQWFTMALAVLIYYLIVNLRNI